MPGRKAVTKISGIQGLPGGMARASPSTVIHRITAAIAGMTPSGPGEDGRLARVLGGNAGRPGSRRVLR